MARINVEDSLQGDIRFINLTLRMGSMKLALGELVWAWKVAQKFHLNKDTNRCIPYEEWSKQECSDHIIAVGLAEKTEYGVRIAGAKEQFGWLEQRQQAGEKSADARKKTTETNERSLTVVEKTVQNSNGSEPLSSYLSTLSSNLKLILPISLISQLVDRVFDEVYPRKIGLVKGRGLALSELKTAEDVTKFYLAAVKYRDFVTDPNNGVQHIYGFKGFVDVWHDWIPEETNLKAI